MAHTPPSAHTVFQGLECPECGLPESHIQETVTSTGLNAFGRSAERLGVKILLACEEGHAYVVGVGEHKGAAFMYARLPLGGEVLALEGYYETEAQSNQRFCFSGRDEPQEWSPRARQVPGERYPRGSFIQLDSGVFA